MADHGRVGIGVDDAPAALTEQATLSLNFNAARTGTVVDGVAGADGVAAGGWNNLAGGNGSMAGADLGLDSGEDAAGLSLDWGANLDGDAGTLRADTHSQIRPDGDQDLSLYEGYLYAEHGDTLGIDLAGLGDLFERYEVHIYLDADDRNSARGENLIAVNANDQTRYVDDSSGNSFQGQYREATAGATAGNYVCITNLSGDLNLRLSALSTSRASKAMISAIQIVGSRRATGTGASATAAALLDAADATAGVIALTEPTITDALFDPFTGTFDDGAMPAQWQADDGQTAATGMIDW